MMGVERSPECSRIQCSHVLDQSKVNTRQLGMTACEFNFFVNTYSKNTSFSDEQVCFSLK